MQEEGLMTQVKQETRECIEGCTECANTCQETLVHCLQKGDRHADAGHCETLIDCAEFCQVTVDFLLRGSEMATNVCGVCADICNRCAQECETFTDDTQMAECAEACRRAADACREVVSGF